MLQVSPEGELTIAAIPTDDLSTLSQKGGDRCFEIKSPEYFSDLISSILHLISQEVFTPWRLSDQQMVYYELLHKRVIYLAQKFSPDSLPKKTGVLFRLAHYGIDVIDIDPRRGYTGSETCEYPKGTKGDLCLAKPIIIGIAPYGFNNQDIETIWVEFSGNGNNYQFVMQKQGEVYLAQLSRSGSA